ncbi:hypothetical protein Prudu_013352 [Prunus dulcis]|uniref:Uncharacterized protein n=1 Tax=Prunus dulcis TaxID=3755 RepID=A0A4Y1RFM8_PRUDU|nr:hypothetical protein Prudu_013352 [Prunus dulcis]
MVNSGLFTISNTLESIDVEEGEQTNKEITIYMFLNQCGYPVTETGCHQIKRCLRTSQLPRFMLPSDMMMSTDIQFTNSSVSALDICLMSFGDARTMSARIADQADYGPLIPARIAARIHYEVECTGIHHQAYSSFHATFEMGDSAEFSARV